MKSIDNKNHIKFYKLKGAIVEDILLYCIDYTSILEISFEVQRILPLPFSYIKVYLFYLIDYGFIYYDGQKKMLLTEKKGFELLYKINKKKRIAMVDSEDIELFLE
jgi:hypothetical protein